MKTKICSKCKKRLSVEKFTKNSKHKDGLQSQCTKCKKQYNKDHYEKNKDAYIRRAKLWKRNYTEWYQAYKDTCICSICGEKEKCCLDFHHHGKEGKDKSVAIIARQRSNKQKLLAEIKKCIVVCANCHRKIHAGIIKINKL